MKKILMVASAASHFENFHIPYIHALSGRGDTVHTASSGVFADPCVKLHTPLPFRKKLFHPMNIAVIFKLARLIRREKYDIVCTNSTLAGFCGRMALKLSRCKNTAALHICHGYLFSDDGSFRSKVYLFFEKLVRKRTDLLAVMNREDVQIAEKYSLGRKILYINGMGLDVSKFPPIPQQEALKVRSELSVGGNELLFLCAAEFSRRKNQLLILKAFSSLQRSDCVLAFAGEGDELENCRKAAKELGISDKVRFLGQQGDMNRLYRAADCLVSASTFEGLPFNVMEALYCGDDVILSDVKGNRDLAESSSLYPCGDAEALTALMEKARPVTQHTSHLNAAFTLESVFEKNMGAFDVQPRAKS